MKKVLKWLSLLFAAGVAVFVAFLFYNVSKEEPIERLEPLSLQSRLKEQKPQAFWLNHFAKREKKGYYLPVEEVYLKVDLTKKIDPRKPYRLIVEDLDPYQVFCLNQELKRHKLRYFFQKTKNETKLLVYSKDLKKLNGLVKTLKNYQIDVKEVKR